MATSTPSTGPSQVEAGKQSLGYVVVLSTITAISGLLFGYNTAVINGVLLFLRRQFTLSNLETEIAASSLLVGALLGAAGASIIGDRYGRKKSLMFSALLFALSPVAAAAASSVTFFSLARLVSGLAIGLASVLTPVYIAEISPPKNRGALVSLNQLGIVIGILISYLASWGLSSLGENSWRWMLGVAAGPSLLFLVGLFAIPESPRWLISQGRSVEAEKTLARMFGASVSAKNAETACGRNAVGLTLANHGSQRRAVLRLGDRQRAFSWAVRGCGAGR
jgi:SP family arabinose:H+ symporter-like MFS transporter